MKKTVNDDIVKRFKKIQRRQYLIILVAVFVLIYTKSHEFHLFIDNIISINGFVLILILLVCIFLNFINWRCPVCNAYLGRYITVKYCNKCGEKLH